MAIKPRGGRGLKAPYEQSHVRTPLPIKDQIESLVNAYREAVLTAGETPIEQVEIPFEIHWKHEKKQSLPSHDEAIEVAREILKRKKSARESLSKLLTAIYSAETNL